jgi:TonB dependent receptor
MPLRVRTSIDASEPMVTAKRFKTMLARSVRSRSCIPRFARRLAAATLALGACCVQPARADGSNDEATGLPVAEAGLRAPPSFNDRQALGDVQWRHQGPTSQWLARVSLGESSRVVSSEVRWLYRGWDGQALTLGALAQHHLLPAVDQRLGAYVNNEWQLMPRWRAVLGACADRTAGGEQALAPRAGLLWDVLPSLQARLLDGVAYREPGASLSPLRDLVPQADASLGSERLRATELGLDWRAIDNLRLAASQRGRPDGRRGGDRLVARPAAIAQPRPRQRQRHRARQRVRRRCGMAGARQLGGLACA